MTMQNKHTPAPWIATGNNITDEYGNKICSTARDHSCDVHNSCKSANACLIASAPDLLEALDNMTRFAYGKLDDPSRSNEMKIFQDAFNAIKKARGENA